MKRSSKVALTILAAGSLAACVPEPVDVKSFDTVDACASAGETRASCESSYNTAAAMHQQVAPKYGTKEDCEAEFGPGNCETGTNSSGGSSWFFPFMMGYMMSSPMNSTTNNPGVAAQPLYRQTNGGYFTASGTKVDLGKSQLNPRNVVKPPASTTTIARGGFGSRAGGFGG